MQEIVLLFACYKMALGKCRDIQNSNKGMQVKKSFQVGLCMMHWLVARIVGRGLGFTPHAK